MIKAHVLSESGAADPDANVSLSFISKTRILAGIPPVCYVCYVTQHTCYVILCYVTVDLLCKHVLHKHIHNIRVFGSHSTIF